MSTPKEYSNGEVTIVWKADLCIHSANCVRGLPEVFKPNEKPWITPTAATTEALIAQVKKCPSGALSYYLPSEEAADVPESAPVRAEVNPNGPLMVHGALDIVTADGQTVRREKSTAFCRCGASANKPFCDGSHRRVGFEG